MLAVLRSGGVGCLWIVPSCAMDVVWSRFTRSRTQGMASGGKMRNKNRKGDASSRRQGSEEDVETVVKAEELTERMGGAVEALKREFSTLRTGRAAPGLLETVPVNIQGTLVPLKSVASISVRDAHHLTVNVFDLSIQAPAFKAIERADLKVTPTIEGKLIRVTLPKMSKEARIEMTKIVSRWGEEAKIKIRNIRRDGMDRAKSVETIAGEDEARRVEKQIQELTDRFTKQIDELSAKKREAIVAL